MGSKLTRCLKFLSTVMSQELNFAHANFTITKGQKYSGCLELIGINLYWKIILTF